MDQQNAIRRATRCILRSLDHRCTKGIYLYRLLSFQIGWWGIKSKKKKMQKKSEAELQHPDDLSECL